MQPFSDKANGMLVRAYETFGINDAKMKSWIELIGSVKSSGNAIVCGSGTSLSKSPTHLSCSDL